MSAPPASAMPEGALLTPTLITMGGGAPRRGRDLGAGAVVRDGALAWRDGVVTYAGPAAGLPPDSAASEPVVVAGAVAPGFVDCHTHLPFFGWRADEFEARLAGRSYRDLHGGGGIYRSARMLRGASDEEVLAFCRPLGAEMLAHGTTALELKTGYGLSVAGELRQARLARRLAGEIPQTATVTLLACHAVPERTTREDWVRTVCDELIPAAAGERLVDAVDVFVEDIAFTVGDLELVAEAAGRHGLALRCHAEQLSASGSAEAAVRLGARNADHLNHLGPAGVQALGRGSTAAVVVPVADLVMRAAPVPVAELLDAGAALCVATDFNPGTSPCLSIPEAVAVAASLYRLGPLEALAACTLNPAWALGLDTALGSLEPGKRADFVVLDAPDVAAIPYRPGHDPVVETWVGGRRAYRRIDSSA